MKLNMLLKVQQIGTALMVVVVSYSSSVTTSFCLPQKMDSHLACRP